MKAIWTVALLVVAVGCGGGIDKSKGTPAGGSPNNTSQNSSNGSNNTSSNNTSSNNTSSNNATSHNTTANNSAGGSCGDGVLDPGELCDPAIADGVGACPSSCEAPACSTASLSGSAATCDARCETRPVACEDGDGCCPAGCDRSTDDDCHNTCGDGIVDGPETCDGNCPTQCNDGDACTTDVLTGAAASCDAECSYDPITACIDDDGCCPAGCDGSDTDCGPIDLCGNGTVDDGELCDGDCPTQCDDGDACTTDSLSGSASTCDARCTYTSVTSCTSGDGCCPDGCTHATDSDCACVPTTCAQLGAECGTIADGCGSTITCTDTCAADETCNVQNACVPEEDFIGEPCTDYPDCGTDPDRACILPPDWPNGYCTILCSSDADCPSSSHCVDFDGSNSACMLNCSSDADCAAGYECRNWDGVGGKECVPPPDTGSGGDVGDACQTDADCDDPYYCETEFQLTSSAGGTVTAPGGACTSACLPLLAPCEADNAVCSLDSYCMPLCASDLDCRTGYTCQLSITGGYCWPS